MALSYEPDGAVVSAFLADPSRVTGIIGPMGSGKTTACIMKALLCCQRQPTDSRGRRRSRGAIIRNTYPELKTTTMKSWHEWIPKTSGRWQEEGPPTHTFFMKEYNAHCEVIFLAMDQPGDIEKLLGTELTWAWLNEVREMPKAVLDAATGRIGRFPPQRDGGCNGPQIFMDGHAPDLDHWYFRLAEIDKPKGFGFHHQPGGRAPNAENLRHLEKDYYEMLASGKNPDWVKVYVDSQYGLIKDGKPVFPEYVDTQHCLEFKLDPELPIHIGMDFGLTPAAVIGQRDEVGRWSIRHEITTEDMGAERFGRELKRFLDAHYRGWEIESITGDPAGDSRVQTDERTAFMVLRSLDIEAMPAPSNDLTVRHDAVAMHMNRTLYGIPAFRIHPDCKVLRQALAGQYCLRRVQVVGQERFRDKPEKNAWSHVAEALEYLMLGAGEGLPGRIAATMAKPKVTPKRAYMPDYLESDGPGAWMI